MAGPAPFLPVTPLIVVHVASGLVALVAGAGVMLARKGRGRHGRFGPTYLAALGMLVASGSMLAVHELPGRWHLLLLGLVALALALVGFVERRRPTVGWMRRHLVTMGSSYVVMLTAFYVDNGPRLPFWWRFSGWALWLFPSVFGIPIIARAWRKYAGGRLPAA